jgi:hypothetical protein
MIRKAITYTLTSILFVLLVVYLLKERSPFGEKNTSFAVDPQNEITAIEFTDDRSTLHLDKKGEEWVVNKKFEIRRSSILFILKILTEMQIKSPVTPEMFNKEIVENGITPVKVKVSEKGRVIKSFLVYKTASNTYGNIMKLREGSKPFIVYVPGNDVEIGSAFTLNELFWKPYTVFNLLPSDIYSVTLVNMADTGATFRIKNENHRFKFYGQSAELAGWDTSRLIRYISYFTHVPFESWAFNLSDDEKQKIKKQEPLYEITVTETGGNKTSLILWERSIDDNGVRKSDTDRLWAKKDGNDEIFIIRYTDIDPLLKKRSYFFTR